jgi:hypothetical protein
MAIVSAHGRSRSSAKLRTANGSCSWGSGLWRRNHCNCSSGSAATGPSALQDARKPLGSAQRITMSDSSARGNASTTQRASPVLLLLLLLLLLLAARQQPPEEYFASSWSSMPPICRPNHPRK